MSLTGHNVGLHWPEHAQQFIRFFASFEHALKRGGYVTNKKRAEADWTRFAGDLGAPFLEAVRTSRIAPTMLAEPPRRMMRDGQWMPDHPAAIADIVELFTRGVCQVRNNLAHGEKRFLAGANGEQRADLLVREATAILEQALPKIAAVEREFARLNE